MNRESSFVLSACVACCAAAPAFAGPPFLSDDPDPTPHHEFEIYTFVSGGWGEAGEDGATGIDFNYGAGPDLQLTATVPLALEHPDGEEFTSGLGNIELAAKFRFLHQDTFGLDVAVFPRLFLPAGSHLGDDHASFLLPVWVGREWEDGSAFGGGGCAINRGSGSQDYCIAGWALTQRVTPDLQVGAELFHATPDAEGGRHSTILGVGLTYDLGETLHLLGYAGAQLQNTDENGDGAAYASMLFTF